MGSPSKIALAVVLVLVLDERLLRLV